MNTWTWVQFAVQTYYHSVSFSSPAGGPQLPCDLLILLAGETPSAVEFFRQDRIFWAAPALRVFQHGSRLLVIRLPSPVKKTLRNFQ